VLHELLQEALAVTLTEIDLRAGAIFLADVPLEPGPAQHPPLHPHQMQIAAQQGFTPAFAERLTTPEPFAGLWNNNVETEVQSVISGFADEVSIQPSDLEQATGPLLSIAATPLISETRLLGWMYVISDRYGAFGPDELDVLRTIGNLLGSPVENARLYDALRQTSGRLSAVLDGIDSGVLLTDEQGIIRYANARLGMLLNVDVADWPGRERAAMLPGKLTRFMPTNTLLDGDHWEIVEPSHRILRRFAESVADHTGATIGSIEVYSDTTQIYEMNQLKDEFVAAAAHDLKTPVTAVKGYAQIALRLARKLDDPKLLQQLTMINARSDDLRLLMDGLLDMSRIQAGRLQLDLQPIVVQQLIANVIKHFDFDLQRKQRAVTCQLPAEPVAVEWDRHRIEGVLINLIGNALKYSPDGGDVSVRVQLVEQASNITDCAVEIVVTDHGIGIPVGERARIFDRFYRTPEVVEYGFRGTGIGLYITHSIVQMHGGRIWADDAVHGGLGTSLFMTLPVHAPRGHSHELSNDD
jgi:two-component system phosphate regulon sensor histidine kinase PhoR